jgi:hypothetical protein
LLLDHHFDDRLPDDEDVALSLLPIVDHDSLRRTAKDRSTIGPIVSEIHVGDLKNFHRDLDRSSRRNRRHTQRSRRQVILPDREALKTHRTHLPSINDPIEVEREKSLEIEASEDEKDPLRQQFQKQRHLFSGKLPANRVFAAGGVQPKDIEVKKAAAVDEGKRREESKGDWKCGNCGIGASGTMIRREGPGGEGSLCNSCGVYWRETGKMDPDVVKAGEDMNIVIE